MHGKRINQFVAEKNPLERRHGTDVQDRKIACGVLTWRQPGGEILSRSGFRHDVGFVPDAQPASHDKGAQALIVVDVCGTWLTCDVRAVATRICA